MTPDNDAASTFFLEAFAPEQRDNPYDLYRRMRETGPFISTEIEMHLAFGHADCWSVIRNPSASSDERNSSVMRREALTDPRIAGMLDKRPLLVFMDPPDHTRLRGLVSQGFTPRRVERLRAGMQRTTDVLIDELMDEAHDEPVDIIERLAYPLPIAVICELLGVPAADHDLFRDWSAALTKSVDPAVLRSDDDNAAIADATTDLNAYTGALLDERRRHPGDDLLSDLLVRHGTNDRLHDDELADLVTLLLVAGHETTVNLIGNGLVALLDHPDQLADWHEHPEVADTAVDELLRYDSPLQMVQRIAVEDLSVAGRTALAGDQIIVMLGAANRDPEVFEEPDRLDIRRRNANRHLSFGGGIHHCLGAALARVEGAIAITALLQRFPGVTASGEAPIRSTFNLRGRSRARRARSCSPTTRLTGESDLPRVRRGWACKKFGNDPGANTRIRYSQAHAYDRCHRDLRGSHLRTYCSTHLTPGSGPGASRPAVELHREPPPVRSPPPPKDTTMYAMDQTMHFEHRSEERRPGWELRRLSTRRSAADPAAPATPAPRPDADTNPTHEFLD